MAAEGDEEAAAQLGTLVTNAPDLDGRWLWLWDAWCALQPSRPHIAAGMSGLLISQPWPWSVIEDYADRTGCAMAERATLHQVLRALERVQLKHDQADARRRMEQQG